MSAFKANRDLYLDDDADNSDDDEGDEEDEVEEDEDGATHDGEDDAGEEEDEEEEEEDEEEAEAGASGSGDGGNAAAKKRKKADKDWLADNFIKASRTSSGPVYKSELLPDKVFFNREKLTEFVGGKRYKKLLKEMRKGMLTHADTERLKRKSEAKREKHQAKWDSKQENKREKRKAKRVLDTDADAEEVEKRQAAFQAKKARRLERKHAAAAVAE